MANKKTVVAEDIDVEEYEQPDVYKLQGKLPGFELRFINKSQLERRMIEGWGFVEGEEANKVKPLKKILDGLNSSVDSKIKLGSQYLMKLPMGKKKKRDAFYQNMYKKGFKEKLNDLVEEKERINKAAGKTIVSAVTMNDKKID